VKPYREAKERVQQHTVFVGNLPVAITVPLLEKTINKKLGKGKFLLLLRYAVLLYTFRIQFFNSLIGFK